MCFSRVKQYEQDPKDVKINTLLYHGFPEDPFPSQDNANFFNTTNLQPRLQGQEDGDIGPALLEAQGLFNKSEIVFEIGLCRKCMCWSMPTLARILEEKRKWLEWFNANAAQATNLKSKDSKTV